MFSNGHIPLLYGFAADITAVEHSLTSRLRTSREDFGMDQSGAVRRNIAMRLRELLTLRTLAAGTVPVANYMLLATFLNFHRGLLLAD
jgi:hypothetical protein